VRKDGAGPRAVSKGVGTSPAQGEPQLTPWLTGQQRPVDRTHFPVYLERCERPPG